MSERQVMATGLVAARSIGPWGTAARVAGGVAALIGAALIGIDVLDALLGLVLFPAAVVGVLLLRGGDAPPLRLTGAAGCCLNGALGVAAFVFLPAAMLLFVGTAMLVAAARGNGGCELFAVSNWLRGRDDQIACPVFSPIDAAEARARRASR
ncbi:MAG: hypothetical protein ACRDWD_16550 [Acidimicrobiia bacterium]